MSETEEEEQDTPEAAETADGESFPENVPDDYLDQPQYDPAGRPI